MSLNHFFSLDRIILFAIFFISTLMIVYLKKTVTNFKSNRIAIGALLFSLVIICGGLYGFSEDNFNGFSYYLFLCVLYLVFGALITFMFKKEYFEITKYKLMIEILVVLVITSLSYFGFSLVFDFTSGLDIGGIYAKSVFFFIIPYFFMLALDTFLRIPTSIYKVWYVNEFAEEPDFDKVNIRNIYLLSVDLMKDVNQNKTTNIRVKAPFEMKFGDWYQSFLVNYNDKYVESPIQYKFLDGTSMGWIFYTKPSLFKRKKFIDANKSVLKNKLNEKLTIVATRVKINYQ